jgi:hypothetical protein
VSICLIFFFQQQIVHSWEVSDTCSQYLRNVPNPDSWSPKDDKFWMKTCDLNWPLSDAVLERDWRDLMNRRAQVSLLSAFGTFCLMVISLIGRWVVKGRLW